MILSKLFNKKAILLVVTLTIFLPLCYGLLVSPVSAAANIGWGPDNSLSPENLANKAGLGVTDPREMASKVINVILGFLGIVAVVLILIGGFMWMTAMGSEEKTGTAKKIMSAGVIGLVIVLAAFGIAKFVISALIGATK